MLARLKTFFVSPQIWLGLVRVFVDAILEWKWFCSHISLSANQLDWIHAEPKQLKKLKTKKQAFSPATEALQCEYAVQGHRGLYGEPLSSALVDLNTKEGSILNLMKDHCNVIKQHNQLWTWYYSTFYTVSRSRICLPLCTRLICSRTFFILGRKYPLLTCLLLLLFYSDKGCRCQLEIHQKLTCPKNNCSLKVFHALLSFDLNFRKIISMWSSIPIRKGKEREAECLRLQCLHWMELQNSRRILTNWEHQHIKDF